TPPGSWPPAPRAAAARPTRRKAPRYRPPSGKSGPTAPTTPPATTPRAPVAPPARNDGHHGPHAVATPTRPPQARRPPADLARRQNVGFWTGPPNWPPPHK